MFEKRGELWLDSNVPSGSLDREFHILTASDVDTISGIESLLVPI
jgi:hypothetical protein